jgi:hypothetical protein
MRNNIIWSDETKIELNINKTKEMFVDFRKQQREHPPIHINWTVVEKVSVYTSRTN